jgi:hypothetical protein
MAISCKSLATGMLDLSQSSEHQESSCTFERSGESVPLHVDSAQRIPSTATYEDAKVEYILSKLSPDEVETAAMASYQYLKNPVLSEQAHHAAKIAFRYLQSKSNVETALPKLKETLKFRRKMDIVGLIQAFDKDPSSDYALHLQEQLSSKKMYVQGYDKQGRSTLLFIPRLVLNHDVEWTVKEAVYSIERAIACSKSKDGLINAVVDFSGFSVTKNAPPLEIGKQFLKTLRGHYAGQIHRIYLVDTPSSFSFFWRIFKSFIGKKTREKIQFLSGESKIKLMEVYDVDQVASWMTPCGTKNRCLDLEEYLFDTPFDRAFDEE